MAPGAGTGTALLIAPDWTRHTTVVGTFWFRQRGVGVTEPVMTRKRARRPKGYSAWEIEEADPYQRLAAAVIVLAVDDANDGDDDAAEWIETEARDWLAWLIPESSTTKVDDLHDLLIEAVDR